MGVENRHLLPGATRTVYRPNDEEDLKRVRLKGSIKVPVWQMERTPLVAARHVFIPIRPFGLL